LDLAAVASDAVESARAIEPDRTIELVASDPVRIVGDASRLRQVIDNLLDNARVHAPGSPVRVEVSLHGEGALLQIGDRGPGLDQPDPKNEEPGFGAAEVVPTGGATE